MLTISNYKNSLKINNTIVFNLWINLIYYSIIPIVLLDNLITFVLSKIMSVSYVSITPIIVFKMIIETLSNFDFYELGSYDINKGFSCSFGLDSNNDVFLYFTFSQI